MGDVISCLGGADPSHEPFSRTRDYMGSRKKSISRVFTVRYNNICGALSFVWRRTVLFFFLGNERRHIWKADLYFSDLHILQRGQSQPLNTKMMEALPGVSRLWSHHFFHFVRLLFSLHFPTFRHRFLHRILPHFSGPTARILPRVVDVTANPPTSFSHVLTKILWYPVTTEWAPVIHHKIERRRESHSHGKPGPIV